ncbi:hypothetical protein B0H12DRAFT_1155514 [Mycena haematopus]|nr:hypothetical protein B0H12DRAFT_1155514 [Mycena haematopus]
MNTNDHKKLNSSRCIRLKEGRPSVGTSQKVRESRHTSPSKWASGKGHRGTSRIRIQPFKYPPAATLGLELSLRPSGEAYLPITRSGTYSRGFVPPSLVSKGICDMADKGPNVEEVRTEIPPSIVFMLLSPCKILIISRPAWVKQLQLELFKGRRNQECS